MKSMQGDMERLHHWIGLGAWALGMATNKLIERLIIIMNPYLEVLVTVR